MKVQEVILPAIAKKITWWQAEEKFPFAWGQGAESSFCIQPLCGETETPVCG
jgi:hypothetical protein